jgi:hypothetical protein
MSIASIAGKIQKGADHVMDRLTKDLTSQRRVWNYIYMGLYVFIALYLTIFHANTCGNTVIVTTGGVVSAIFTNVVWSNTYEKKNKEIPNAKPEVDPGEVGAGD